MGIRYGRPFEPQSAVDLWGWNFGRSLLESDMDSFRAL